MHFFAFFALCGCRGAYSGAVLAIIDGMGESAWLDGNGVYYASTPTLDNLKRDNLYESLVAAQQPVGLISGERGSSAVGHQTLGLGRTELSYMALLERSLDDKSNISLFHNALIRNSFKRAHSQNSTIHLTGLCSDTGIFSNIKYLEPIFRAAAEENVSRVNIHCMFYSLTRHPSYYITEIYRMVPPSLNVRVVSAHSEKTALNKKLDWNSTSISYNSFFSETSGVSKKNFSRIVDSSYRASRSFSPIVMRPVSESIVHANDTIIIFNHREDLSYQIADALIHGIPHSVNRPAGVEVIPFILYDKSLNDTKTVFPAIMYQNGIAEWISKLGLKQLRVAEEYKKYHVTSFFSGGILQPVFSGEERIVDIMTVTKGSFDQNPLMNASLIGDAVVNGISSKKYALIVANFANVDATGHCGNSTAVKIALEFIDLQIKRILEQCEKNNYALFVTADHGNGEENIDARGGKMIDHTVNNVPFLSNAQGFKLKKQKIGRRPYLGNVAPTILTVLGLPIPKEMDESIFEVDWKTDANARSLSQASIIYPVVGLCLIVPLLWIMQRVILRKGRWSQIAHSEIL